MCFFFACTSFNAALAQRIDRARDRDAGIKEKPDPYYPYLRFRDRHGDPFSNHTNSSPLFLKAPNNIKLEISLDTGMNYIVREKINTLNFRPPSSMTFAEFDAQQTRTFKKQYWKARSKRADEDIPVSEQGLIPKIYVGPALDRLFGGNYVELIPRGFVTLDFGGSWQKIENPSIPIRQQNSGGFNFDQQINLNVVGKIGEKLSITTNFDNNSSFDFQNNLRVEYTGFKEDVLKKMEIGNVSMPLNNSLISGARNLFGAKMQLQFGKLLITSIAATQRGKQSSVETQGGADQGNTFEIVGSNYDENRHFFLGHFFRDHYESWMGATPQFISGVNITRIEIYVLNRQNNTQTLRNVLALMDMGESDRIYRKNIITTSSSTGTPADNAANNLFKLLAPLSPRATGINTALENLGFINGTDFEKITSARKLAESEFTFHKKLGYITLQRKLQNDEVLAVAFEYTYNGRKYKVGELTEDYADKTAEDVIYLKLLRPRKISIKDERGAILPTWNLMMKNIYNLNVSQLEREGFQLRVIYRDDRTGIDNPQLQDGNLSRTKQLIEVFGLDKLNPYNDPQPDGNFDFVEGITIDTKTGLIIFPFLHPFEDALKQLFAKEDNANTIEFLRQKYIYDTLYRTTRAEAELVAAKNKFYIVGSFKAGSGRDIIIQGFNLTPGSVRVYAGELLLKEGTDYSVDYNFGKVTILNEGILSSGKKIRVTYEQQDPFSFQTRTLLGARLDYRLNPNINIGSTFLYYNERPLISRNLIGAEPSRNFKYGLDVNTKTDSRFLTKLIDKLPFLQTKAKSTINFNAEFAQLVPGTSNIVNGEGTSFIDDFENSATPYSMMSPRRWRFSAIPKTDDNRFDPTGGAANNIEAGYKRAKIAWYQIDNQFYAGGSLSFRPSNISDKDLRNHYMRAVPPVEIFPFFDAFVGNFNEPILNVAYYPSERGVYNFNPNLNPDGTLKNPAENWGGITTAVRTEVDFDKSNIEYLEFWLMDPFINTENGRIIDSKGGGFPNITGGQLVFHLGSLSEDLMRDGEHAFENGLPEDGNLTSNRVAENNWGYVTTQQYINGAFNNSAATRKNQDVGLDGVDNARELEKFSAFVNQLNPAAREIVLRDPAADDFQYFLDDKWNEQDAKILERYKNFNGLEHNSPIISGNDPLVRSGSTIPDNEDLNQDNTLSNLEEYYAYRIDLSPSTLQVGRKYIVDQVRNEVNGDLVKWYLFRIPVRQFDAKVGDINGFKSIRYARVVLTQFSQPVVLRMAKFRLVGTRWRRYTESAAGTQPGGPVNPNLNNFSVSVVNVEENGQGNDKKPAYIPPLKRDRDVTSTIQRRLNEQAIQLCVNELSDGDTRFMFKNVSMDLFNYRRIKMFLSAHGQNLEDDELLGVIRLGTDFEENYYEIELPLKISKSDANTIEAVWPDANQINLDMNELYALKAQRDREKFPLSSVFPSGTGKRVGHHLLRIYGRPDLSQVKVIMIGIRNPKSEDGKPKSVCVWGNELRVTEFDRTSGVAANASLSVKLADLGSVTGSVRYTSFGYGSVQSRISERQRAATTTFDISANLNLGKLLPEKAGIQIPFFIGFENRTIAPQYDPANPDMRIDAAFKSFATEVEKEAYQRMIQDRFTRYSINFTNVRKTKVNPKAKKHIYDIENFAFTYTYTEAKQTNFNFLENTKRNTIGIIAWQYRFAFKGFQPFQKIKFLSSPHLRAIRDFNFNPLPSFISVRAILDRSFSKLAYRNAISDRQGSIPAFQKFFVFNRSYNLQWNLTKNLGLTYNSAASTIIDEPDGDIDTKEKLDSILGNLKKFGRMKSFEQNIAVNYKAPFDKIPIVDWIGAEYRYSVGYFWIAGSLHPDSTLQFGNTIQNKRNQTLAGKVNMLKLYNKINWLRDANMPNYSARSSTGQQKTGDSKTPDESSPPPRSDALKGLARILMLVRNIRGSYSLGEGTTLPGFTPSPFLFGFDDNWSTPGIKFILGDQDFDFRFRASEKGWVSKNEKLSTPYTQIRTESIDLQADIEPWQDIKIQLTANRTLSSSFQEIFRFSAQKNDFISLGPSRGGAYKISALAIGTAFQNNTSITSSVFQQFERNLGIIQKRFQLITGNEYTIRSQDVLVPAFLAAYTGKNANTALLSPFPQIPVPGWRVNYGGLNKIPALKNIFDNIMLRHAYSSSYTVVNYTSSLDYANVGFGNPLENYNKNFFSFVNNASGNPIPIYILNQVVLTEAFAPLIGLDMRLKKNITLRFEYKTKRDLALNISNAQITEVNSQNWSMEAGYTKKGLRLPWRHKGKTITLKNDLIFRFTAGISNNHTVQRKINDVDIITNGNINFRLRPSINYTVNKKLSLQLYVDYNSNEPLVTNSYKRSTTQAGIKILFNLSQ